MPIFFSAKSLRRQHFRMPAALISLLIALLASGCSVSPISPPPAATAASTNTAAAPATPLPSMVPPDPGLLPDLAAADWAFTTYGDRPVLQGSENGPDRGRIDPGAVIFHEGRYHMFRNAFQTWPGPVSIGYRVSEDGLTWKSGAGRPVLTTEDIGWDGIVAANATSALVEDDGTWVLYFHTWHTLSASLGDGFIGRATAPAPEGPWTLDPEPVLRMGADAADWDGGQVSQASVIRSGGQYRMYYTGADRSGFMRIGLAFSEDGITWKKYDDPETDEAPFAASDPVLEPDPGSWDRQAAYQSRVVQTPGGLVMVYKTFARQPFASYGIALSADGVHWEKSDRNPVVIPEAVPDGVSLEGPGFLYHDGIYRLYTEAFTGSATQTEIYMLFFADQSAQLEDLAALAPQRQLIYTAFGGGGPHLGWERTNLNRYLADNPDLEAELTTGDYYANFVMTALDPVLAADPPPDVVSSLMAGVLREQVEAGAIMDISDIWEAQGWDEAFPPSLKEWASYDGRQYFVPMAIQWNGIFYRKDIFDDVGLTPPATWEELLATCDRLNEVGITPFTVSVSQWPPPAGFWFTAVNLRLNGPDYHERLMRGAVRYDDPQVRAVFEHIAQLFEHACFRDDSWRNDYQTGISEFSEGQVAMYNHGEWLYEFIPQQVKDVTGYFPYPMIDPDVPNGELVPMWGAFIPAAAPHPAEARLFLAYLGSEESQRSNFEALGRVASHLGVDRQLYDDVHRQGLELVEAAGALTQLLGFNTNADVARAGYRAIQEFWQNPPDIDDILERWEAARSEAYGELPLSPDITP